MFVTPTHNLQQIQALIRVQGTRAFTSMAIACGRRELTMTVQEMIDMILARNDIT